MSAYLETITGRSINVIDPNPEDINIRDIAWGLSMQCRFGGHLRRHYSVAEHSINVSKLVPEQYALRGLMHDATEAYLCDVPTPIKKHMPIYYEIEAKLHIAICARFGISSDMPQEVKDADARICITEKIQLLSGHGLDSEAWIGLTSRYSPYTVDELYIPTTTVPQPVMYDNFLARFRELTE